MFKALFGQNTSTRHAHALYGVVVARSRDGVFFEHFGVPDTFDGRFEILVMHLFVLHARLKDEDLDSRKISQLVFDKFIDDMDAALREAGVGDHTLPKRIAKMTQVFYGRTGAYEAALLSEQSQDHLAKVIERNLYPDGVGMGKPIQLSEYMLAQVDDLQNKTVEEIIKQHNIYQTTFKET